MRAGEWNFTPLPNIEIPLISTGLILFSFQNLFQCDQILYTIIPVSGKEELERAFIENSEGVSQEFI